MNVELSEEALAYGSTVRQAFADAGGDRLVRDAELEPAKRESAYAPVLAEVGAWELEPRADGDDLEASAAVCRAAGYWCAAYPVAERLARPADGEADGLLVVGAPVRAAAVAGLDLRWATVTVDGRRGLVTAVRPDGAPRTTAFVGELEIADAAGDGAEDLALGLVLPCWTLLGMLDRALDLARDHVLVREQFGQRLSSFQGVQFQVTEAEVERAGLEMLAKYALWSVRTRLPAAVADALALRLAAIEAAEVVFRVAHQLHGAIGFCDETQLSWLSRYSQPLRRLPLGLSATRSALVRKIGRQGLPGLFHE
ncbi:acyl-CoA dehydrogenase family protein [Actinomadura sp. NTSP31]|uniref:acyl-CoA dehydrogenase family protein n=1 Tax=Actinomadura sp. NTSP31 TaxID=1735447 RepID=UPI0035C0785A